MDRMEDSGSFGRSSILRGATKMTRGLPRVIFLFNFSHSVTAPEKGGRERYRKPPVEVFSEQHEVGRTARL